MVFKQRAITNWYTFYLQPLELFYPHIKLHFYNIFALFINSKHKILILTISYNKIKAQHIMLLELQNLLLSSHFEALMRSQWVLINDCNSDTVDKLQGRNVFLYI